MTLSWQAATVLILAGVACLLAELIEEAHSYSTIGVGIIFVVAGIVSLARGRRSPPPPAT